jgi:uncharacterized protein YndB with AHSA1/START domain
VTTDPNTINIDELLPYPPAKVWKVLTDPELLSRWLMPNDFKLEVGHRFTFQTRPIPSVGFDGVILCKVLGFEVERMLRISWGGGGLDTTVTWRLEPEGHGTRLFLEHAGFDLDDPNQWSAIRGMGNGWRSQVFPAMIPLLRELSETEATTGRR